MEYVRAGDIAGALNIGHSTLSGHLKVLRHAELLVARRSGTEFQYRANPSTLDEVILTLSDLRGPGPDAIGGYMGTNKRRDGKERSP